MIALVILQWVLVAIQVALMTTAQSTGEVVMYGFGLGASLGFAISTTFMWLNSRRH